MKRLERSYQKILEQIGEDPQREGLLKTPQRAAAAMQFMTQGYQQSLEEIVNGAIFHEENNQMVLLRDIEFYSNCEHHMLPFFVKNGAVDDFLQRLLVALGHELHRRRRALRRFQQAFALRVFANLFQNFLIRPFQSLHASTSK